MQNTYSSHAFETAYTYSGNDLGAAWTREHTVFRLWAPTAQEVLIRLFSGGTPWEDPLLEEVPMVPSSCGTWFLQLDGDWSGKYYTYAVTVNGITREACDPYARTTGINGERAMILDPGVTDPAGWETDAPPCPVAAPTDAIIYETHIRDISMDPHSGIQNKGKFLGLAESGTKNSQGTSTGLDHIKSLGVTHVQLMPIYDFGSVDESRPGYNWGYDPVNYNVPEGAYSTDPWHGEVRVKELKQLIAKLHSEGLGVIMDVVYNHVFHTEEFCFNQIVPGYFSRPGSNGSGCGNDTASERSMVRKYIVDSLLYWVEEYHMDGFRFDLAGLIDVQTLQEAMEIIRAKFPHVLFFGEGWTMNSLLTKPDTVLATQKASRLLPEFGFFNDTHRDLLRGSVFKTRETGYAAGGEVPLDSLRSCFMGVTPWACSPGQSINYISCHDNNTLFDRISLSLPKTPRKERVERCKLAAAFNFLSQGVPFFLCGEEMLRSKPTGWGRYDENSYRSPDHVNTIKWSLLAKSEYRRNVQYYRGLISLRKEYDCLRLRTRKEVLSTIKSLPTSEPHTLAFRIRGKEERMLFLFHSGKKPTSFTLPDGSWQVLVNKDTAGIVPLETVAGTIQIPPISAMVLVQPKPKQTRDVVAALIWKEGKFLICQRPPHKARGMLWEFVGGKTEAGESLQEALVRECREELDITVAPGDVFLAVEHRYPDIHIKLTLFHCTIRSGEPKALEHNDIRWISPAEIPEYSFCPADKDILEVLKNYPV